MSLRINVELVKDKEGLVVSNEFGEETLDLVTRTLGCAMMGVGIGSITDQNKDEILRRLGIMENLNGAYLGNDEGDRFFTMEDLDRRVGMYTNVITVSKKKFADNVLAMIEGGST